MQITQFPFFSELKTPENIVNQPKLYVSKPFYLSMLTFMVGSFALRVQRTFGAVTMLCGAIGITATVIRYVWATKMVNEKKAKEELAKRIELCQALHPLYKLMEQVKTIAKMGPLPCEGDQLTLKRCHECLIEVKKNAGDEMQSLGIANLQHRASFLKLLDAYQATQHNPAFDNFKDLTYADISTRLSDLAEKTDFFLDPELGSLTTSLQQKWAPIGANMDKIDALNQLVKEIDAEVQRLKDIGINLT